MYRLLPVFLVLILLGAGCAPAPAEPTPPAEPSAEAPPETEPSAPDRLTIIFTDTGYAPKTLSISQGMTVTFQNNSSIDMWPASASHPTHRVYPTTGGCLGSTFDACANIHPGDSWSFTFDEAGTWNYHDHITPGALGTITVE